MTASISVRLERTPAHFEPGDPVEGFVILEAGDLAGAEVHYAEVMLFWQTDGKGTQDEGIAGKIEILEKDSPMPARHEHRFSWEMPRMPWSYQGKLIKINWYVGAYARAGRNDEISNRIDLVLYPPSEDSRS